MPYLPIPFLLARNVSASPPSCSNDPSSGTFSPSCSSPDTSSYPPTSGPGQLAVIGLVSCGAFLLGAVAFAWWLYSHRRRHPASGTVPVQVQPTRGGTVVVRIPRKVFLAAKQKSERERKRAQAEHELDEVRSEDEGLETMNTFTTTMLEGLVEDGTAEAGREAKPSEQPPEAKSAAAGEGGEAAHRSVILAGLPTLTYNPPDAPAPAYRTRESYIPVPLEGSMPSTPVAERGPS